MKTPDVVKTTPRRVTRHVVTEAQPVIVSVQLSPTQRSSLLEALGVVDTSGLIVGELGERYEHLPRGSACARFHGSQGYVLHVVDEPEPADASINGAAPRDLDGGDSLASLTTDGLEEEFPPLPQRDLDGSIDDAETREAADDLPPVTPDTDGVTDPDVNAEELEEAKDRITHEIGVRIEAERDQLRRDVTTLKVDHDRMKVERDEAVKALTEHLAANKARFEREGGAVPPPRTVVRAAKRSPPAKAKEVAKAKAKLNEKFGKGAGRSK